MVVPDRIMQAERLVALAPAVTGAVVLFDDDGRHVLAAQARTQGNATLPAADNDDIGLLGVSQFLCLAGAGLGIGLSILEGPVFDPMRTGPALLFGIIDQLLRGCQQGPAAFIVETHMPPTAHRVGFECHPGLGDAIGLGRVAVYLPVLRMDVGQAGPGHFANGIPPLHRLDIPRKRDQIAPVTIRCEQSLDGLDILRLKRVTELCEPRINATQRRCHIHELILPFQLMLSGFRPASSR